MRWPQERIEQWATSTFGPGTALASCARGAVEYGELLNDLGNGVDPLLDQLLAANMQIAEAICSRVNQLHVEQAVMPQLIAPGKARGKECPDVAVMLLQTAERCGVSLLDATDTKMDINEGRRWGVTASGRRQHI